MILVDSMEEVSRPSHTPSRLRMSIRVSCSIKVYSVEYHIITEGDETTDGHVSARYRRLGRPSDCDTSPRQPY